MERHPCKRKSTQEEEIEGSVVGRGAEVVVGQEGLGDWGIEGGVGMVVVVVVSVEVPGPAVDGHWAKIRSTGEAH